jgi:hypothetical protein
MTMRGMPRGLAFLGLLLATLPAPARAADAADPYRIRVNLAFYAGVQRYSMSDVNDAIDATNTEIRTNPVTAQSGVAMSHYHGGMGVGAGLRVWPRDRILIAADYGYLSGASSASGLFNTQPNAPSLKLKFGVPAQSLGLTAGYFFYKPSASLDVGLGAGAAYYIGNGVSEVTYPGFHQREELHGTGIGVHGLLLGDLRLSNTVRLEAALGYRRAKTKDLKANGITLLNADGSKTQADYSGIVSRIGIDIPFGPVK